MGATGAIDDGFEALLEPFYNGKKLTDPISTKEDKYQLLPAFLKVKGAFSIGGHAMSPAGCFANLQSRLDSRSRQTAH